MEGEPNPSFFVLMKMSWAVSSTRRRGWENEEKKPKKENVGRFFQVLIDLCEPKYCEHSMFWNWKWRPLDFFCTTSYEEMFLHHFSSKPIQHLSLSHPSIPNRSPNPTKDHLSPNVNKSQESSLIETSSMKKGRFFADAVRSISNNGWFTKRCPQKYFFFVYIFVLFQIARPTSMKDFKFEDIFSLVKIRRSFVRRNPTDHLKTCEMGGVGTPLRFFVLFLPT